MITIPSSFTTLRDAFSRFAALAVLAFFPQATHGVDADWTGLGSAPSNR